MYKVYFRFLGGEVYITSYSEYMDAKARVLELMELDEMDGEPRDYIIVDKFGYEEVYEGERW